MSAAKFTVVARDAMTADSLETAVSVLGPAEELALVDATPGAAAVLVEEAPDGVRATGSARWAAFERAVLLPG